MSLQRLCIVLSCLVYVSSPAWSSPLDQARALYKTGDTTGALKILAEIKRTDPDRQQADVVRALCLYDSNKDKRYLKAADALSSNSAGLAPEVKRDLAVKYLRAALRQKLWENIINRTTVMQGQDPALAGTTETLEYRMAALYERGIKKAYEANQLEDPLKSGLRRQVAVVDLTEFLRLATKHDGNYRVDPRRTIQGEIIRASIALGDESTLQKKLTPAEQENFTIVRIRAHLRMWPDQITQNMQLMDAFVSQFPASAHGNEIRFHRAEYMFHAAEEAQAIAGRLELGHGDAAEAARQRAIAEKNFDGFRKELAQVKEDHAGGVEASDLLDQSSDLLYSHLLQKNLSKATALADAMTTASKPGSLAWATGNLYQGIALMKQLPPEPARAIPYLEAAMTLGIRGQAQNDKICVTAILYRIVAARKLGDEATAQLLFAKVDKSPCARPIKEMLADEKATTPSLQLAQAAGVPAAGGP